MEPLTKYTLLLALLIGGVITALYTTSTIQTRLPILLVALLVGMFLLLMMIISANTVSTPLARVSAISFATQLLTALVALGMMVTILYWLVTKFWGSDFATTHTWLSFLVNVSLALVALGLLYKLVVSIPGIDWFLSMVRGNKYVSLMVNVASYLPCLLVSSFSSLFSSNSSPSSFFSSFPPPTSMDYKFLVLSITLIILGVAWMTWGKHVMTEGRRLGGEQVLIGHDPISLTTPTSFSLHADTLDYQYAISCWVYLDSFAPSSIRPLARILSVGDNPAIKYQADINTLTVTCKPPMTTNMDNTNKMADAWLKYKGTKEKEEKGKEEKGKEELDLDAEGDRILYTHPEVLLQKWNHLVLNYRGGTMDMFYNGKLVKAAIQVVPYRHLDLIVAGTDNGVSGNMAKLLYFNQPLDYLTIHSLASSVPE